MSNKNILFKFLTLIITFAAVFCLTACGKQGGMEAWDLFVSGVNSGDTTKIAKALYTDENDIEEFANTTAAEYLYTVGNIKTEKYKTTIVCDFSTDIKTEVYYGAEVTAKIDGVRYTFTIYSSETSTKGVLLCSLPQYTEDGFGNTPNEDWYRKGYFTEEAYLYQVVTPRNGGEATVTISQQNKNQKNVVIPEEINGLKVTTIGAYAFFKYTNILSFTTKSSKLRTIQLPDTLLKIEKYAFYQCGKLQEIEIPNSVKTIGQFAFSSCTNMEKVVINVEDADIYNGLKEIQSTTTQTGDEAIVITGCKEIYAGDIMVLSASALGIPQQDIQWSTNNTDLISIETDALNNAKIYAKKNGTNVTITASYKQNPSIKATVKLVIKSVPEMINIDYSAFNRCYGLTDLYLTSLNPNSITISAGNYRLSLSEDVTIWVPKGTKELYQYHTSWSVYANQIKEVE